MQVSKINQVLVEETRVIYDVAQTDVKMPVHTLKRADDDTVFGRRHAKYMSRDLGHASTSGERTRDDSLLPGLAQTSSVNFDEFGQSRHNKVPLVRKTVSPAAVREGGIEARAHG